MKYLLGSIGLAITLSASADMTPEQIRSIREFVEYQKDLDSLASLTAEEKAARQSIIDAEVTMHFKKRVQMRPSDVRAIDPACDEWLKLYKETGWSKAKQGIADTCP